MIVDFVALRRRYGNDEASMKTGGVVHCHSLGVHADGTQEVAVPHQSLQQLREVQIRLVCTVLGYHHHLLGVVGPALDKAEELATRLAGGRLRP